MKIETNSKLWLLKQLVLEKFNNYKSITAIYRVSNSTLLIEFDRDNRYYFDVTKGSNSIYKRDDFFKIKRYNAPFDVALQKRFIKSTINRVYLLDDDKVLRVEVNTKSSYKEQNSILQIELTGKNSNIIILDSNSIVIEALRHIDITTSYREIKPNKKLLALPANNYIAKEHSVDDIDLYLFEVYKKIQSNRLDNLKKQKVSQINKQIDKLNSILNGLENSEELSFKSKKNYNIANIILANIHNIKPYQKSLETYDFDGNIIKIELPLESNVSKLSTIFFNRAKKFKQKAKNIHIQYGNLKDKLDFFNRLKDVIINARNSDEIELYMPSNKKQKTKVKAQDDFKIFNIDEYRVLMGRNETENIKLLKSAKATDFWMHLKDRPSSHIIIPTKKKTLPDELLQKVAKICVDFNTSFDGNYEVDYAKRRDIALQNGANVLYNNYKTIVIKKNSNKD